VLLPNNTPYQIKNAAGTAKNVVNKNASNQTTVGENDVRATRYVPINPRVEVLNTDPADANWNDLDLTANTSANTYAVALHYLVRASVAVTTFKLRKNGVASDGNLEISARTQVATQYVNGSRIVEVDTGQILEWAVDSSNVNSVIVILDGYFEYVD